jgi:hypothetical protein
VAKINKNKILKESELYEPMKQYFLEQGAKVHAEVRGNDMVVIQDELYFGIELKKTFNLELVFQLLRRRGLFHGQYGVIEVKKGTFHNKTQALMLLSALGFGLYGVEFLKNKPKVMLLLQCSKREDSIFFKGKTRLRMISEISSRFIEYGDGGVNTGGALSSYRQRALYALWLIQKKSSVSPKDLNLSFSSQSAGSLLQDNFYGWFLRKQRGCYIATDAGLQALSTYAVQIELMARSWEILFCKIQDS